MKVMYKTSVTWVLVLLYFCAHGQIEKFDYIRKLQGKKDQWHKVELPKDIFGKVLRDLSDIRIYGVTESKDTLEVPYVIKVLSEKRTGKEINFRLINESKNQDGYFFTFELPAESAINQIDLDFKQQNFDWHINLEGSQDLRKWFTITEDYRILAIRNQDIEYEYTNLRFPISRYKYFRVFVKTDKNPQLSSAKIVLDERVEGIVDDFEVKVVSRKEDRKRKQTVVDIALKLPCPVSIIKVDVKAAFDYYRPIIVEYVSDSFNTEKGWRYNYVRLTSGILNSIQQNEFKVNSTILNKMRITIDNQDNEPLEIKDIEVKGYKHQLIARFTREADHFLVYGNTDVEEPHYDIINFQNKVPEEITALQLEEEQLVHKKKEPKTEPLFKDKVWLWAVMAVLILVLGLFSIKMIRKG